MNQIFEVLIWNRVDGETLNDTDREEGFATYENAKAFYDSITNHKVKMLMQYESLEPDADGKVLEEDWK